MSSISIGQCWPSLVSHSGWCWLVFDGGSLSLAGWVGGSCVREMSGGGVGIEYLLHKDKQ